MRVLATTGAGEGSCEGLGRFDVGAVGGEVGGGVVAVENTRLRRRLTRLCGHCSDCLGPQRRMEWLLGTGYWVLGRYDERVFDEA